MANNSNEPTQNDAVDAKTRANLAYIFSISSIVMISYILYNWGNQREILTLIIGLIGGTLLGSVSGVYFGGSTYRKSDTSVQGDNAVVINPKTNDGESA